MRCQSVRLVVLACLGILAAISVACAAGQLVLPGDLRVGLHTDYQPVVFRNEAGIVGIEPDLARMVGESLGRRVRFVPLERADLVNALEEGRVDILMTGMSVTAERSQRIRFVEPYAQVGQMALFRRDRAATLGRASDLRRPGVRVAFVKGTTGEEYVTQILDRCMPVPLDSVTAGEVELRNDRVEYFIHDAPTAWRIGMDVRETELMGLYRPLTEEWLAWAVRMDDIDLASKLDALAIQWRRDGTVDRVINAWVPVRVRQ